MLQRPAQQTWASNLSKAPCSFSEYNPLSPIPPSLLLSWSPPLSTFSRDSWGFRTRKELQHSLVHSSIPTSFYRAKPWGPQRGNTANDQARTRIQASWLLVQVTCVCRGWYLILKIGIYSHFLSLYVRPSSKCCKPNNPIRSFTNSGSYTLLFSCCTNEENSMKHNCPYLQ